MPTPRKRLRLVALVVTTTLSAVGLVVAPIGDGLSSPAHASAATPTTYRVLTYNVQDLPTIVDHEDPYGIDDELRMSLIGDRLAASNFDIIALNEAFTGDVNITLMNKLAPVYQTRFSGFTDGIELDNSGLAIASKFPVIPVDPPSAWASTCYHEQHVPTYKCLTAFHEFDNGSGWDGTIAKGIAFVKLRNTVTNRPINVFFTHLQADQDAESRQVRATQVKESIQFIQGWAPANEDTVFMGDLNIIAKTDGQFTNEYQTHIGVSGLASIGLRDAWRVHGSPEDEGWTFDRPRNTVINGSAGERLDYVLYRPGKPADMCLQHSTLLRDYRYEGEPEPDLYINTDLSDHYGLAATIGGAGPQCSPDLRKLNPADGLHSQEIIRPGGYQWFRYDTPGTYSFKVSNQQSRMELKVFLATDLTQPIGEWEGNSELTTLPGDRWSERVVHALDEPFYVRIRAVAAAGAASPWTGGYVFSTKRHEGLTFDEAIVLNPYTHLAQKQMSNLVASPASTIHYAFQQWPLYSGARQELLFSTSGHDAASYRIRVFDAARNPIPGLATDYAPLMKSLHVQPATSPISATQQKLFFTVDRLGCVGNCLSTYDVFWTTNLRKLDVRDIYVADLNDEPETSENDEVKLYVSVDGGPEQMVWFGTMDEEGHRGMPSWLRNLTFDHAVTMRAADQDDEIDDISQPESVWATSIPIYGTSPWLSALVFNIGEDGTGTIDGKYQVNFAGSMPKNTN